MSDLVYNYGKIATSTEAIDTFITSMESYVEELEDQVEKKLMPTWDGQSREAYYSAQTDWTAAMNAIKGILNQVKISVNEGAENMDLTDKRWATAFGAN